MKRKVGNSRAENSSHGRKDVISKYEITKWHPAPKSIATEQWEVRYRVCVYRNTHIYRSSRPTHVYMLYLYIYFFSFPSPSWTIFFIIYFRPVRISRTIMWMRVRLFFYFFIFFLSDTTRAHCELSDMGFDFVFPLSHFFFLYAFPRLIIDIVSCHRSVFFSLSLNDIVQSCTLVRVLSSLINFHCFVFITFYCVSNYC